MNSIEKLSPPVETDELTGSRYINDLVLDQPETALVLAEKEQARLLGWLPRYTNAMRPGENDVDIEKYHEFFLQIAKSIHNYLSRLAESTVSRKTTRLLMNVESRQGHLNSMESDLLNLTEIIRGFPVQRPALIEHLIESLDTMLLTAIEAVNTGDKMEYDLLGNMTGDRSDVIRELRQKYLAAEQNMDIDLRMKLMQATNIFSRIVWQLGSFSRLARDTAATGEKSSQPAAAGV